MRCWAAAAPEGLPPLESEGELEAGRAVPMHQLQGDRGGPRAGERPADMSCEWVPKASAAVEVKGPLLPVPHPPYQEDKAENKSRPSSITSTSSVNFLSFLKVEIVSKVSIVQVRTAAPAGFNAGLDKQGIRKDLPRRLFHYFFPVWEENPVARAILVSSEDERLKSLVPDGGGQVAPGSVAFAERKTKQLSKTYSVTSVQERVNG